MLSNLNSSAIVLLGGHGNYFLQVHSRFNLVDETLFLTMNILDRFLHHRTITRKHLQLVGVTAMLVACKYEEVLVPVINDFILICDNAYSREQVLEMVIEFFKN